MAQKNELGYFELPAAGRLIKAPIFDLIFKRDGLVLGRQAITGRLFILRDFNRKNPHHSEGRE